MCVCIPALLCVKSHCVMLTMCALALSPWLYSSGQTKASGVFSFLQNGIIWQLFLLQGTDCRGQLFMPLGPVHIMHRGFVLLILMCRNNTLIYILNRAKGVLTCAVLECSFIAHTLYYDHMFVFLSSDTVFVKSPLL